MKGTERMADKIFQVGDPVFFYTMIDRIPGVIESAEQNENGHWVYTIKVGDTMIAKNVYEHMIVMRKIMDAPKYKRGDKVRFLGSKEKQYVGCIEIIDPYGTFEQAEEPSYDILVKGEPGCLYKHIRESQIMEIEK